MIKRIKTEVVPLTDAIKSKALLGDPEPTPQNLAADPQATQTPEPDFPAESKNGAF